jgi:hypothetical protein
MEEIYQRYRVEMKQPQSFDEFLRNVAEFERLRKTGSQQLFTEIELEVKEKSKFLKQQVKGIEEMVNSYRLLLAKINVLRNAAHLFRVSQDEPANPEAVYDNLENGGDPLATTREQKDR